MDAAAVFHSPRTVSALADLFSSVWQVAYVTPDLDRAMGFMAERFGLARCTEVPTDTARVLGPDGDEVEWDTRIAMGARGGLIVELIEPVGGDVDYYNRFLPPDGAFGVRFHHFATVVPTGEDEWRRIDELLAAAGLRFEHTVLIPDRVRAGYVDMSADLGHLLEVCQLQPADIELFTGLIRDSA